jgi:hypothetical protein
LLIQSTARPQSAVGSPVHDSPKAKEQSNSNPEQLSQPVDSMETSEFGEGVRHLTGGVAGVGLSLAGVYAGVLGGAVVGSLFGAGMGPAVASLSSKGALGFVSGIWNSTSVAAKIGMAIGGASGLVGGFKLGSSAGNGLARVVGAGPVQKRTWKPLNQRGRTATTVLTGLGSTSGLVGGTLIGAGLGATGSILARGFDLANLGGASLTGAGIGLVAGTAIAGAGSYLLAREGLNLIQSRRKPDGEGITVGKKALMTATGAFIGAVAGALPVVGAIGNGIVLSDVSTDTKSQTLGALATGVSAAANVVGTIGLIVTGNPLYLAPAVVTGALGHGIMHASDAF